MSTSTPASALHKIVLEAHDIAETTRERYLRDLDQWIEFAGADPKGWTRATARDFYNDLLKRMLPQSANRLMASLNYASKWWAHYSEKPDLHFAFVQQAKARGQRPQPPLTESEVRALLATCDDSMIGVRDFALIVVGLETGMRRMSLAGMTLSETLMTAEPQRTQAPPFPATKVPIKGKQPKWVPLSDTAVLALSPWLEVLRGRALGAPVFCAIARRVVSGRRQLAPLSQALSMSGIAKIFSEHAKAAGLAYNNPHLMRHTFITDRGKRGLSFTDIAAITHHDVKGRVGAIGGYLSSEQLGAIDRVRNSTPEWLAKLVRDRVSRKG